MTTSDKAVTCDVTHAVVFLQVGVDLLSYRRSREDADLLSGLALLSRGLGQRLHPAAGSRSK